MAIDGSKQPRGSVAPPPRTLNVQKFAESRACELETLHSIVANRLNNDFRSCRNKRRRTTGYDNRVAKNKDRKRQKLGVGFNNNITSNVEEKDQKKVPRRIRRRVELKKNPDNGYCTSGDGTKWLRTHVWHAKRFTMTKLWGFYLPLGLQGRGRGSRALLKWFKHGSLVHDASYCGAVQLEGPEDSLLSVLRMVLVPHPSAHTEDISRSILSGAIYGNAILHHIGAPLSQLIAPVTYMWHSFCQQNIGTNADDSDSNGYNEPQRIGCTSSIRKLWVWIHASAFSEGYEALRKCCQKQMDETGILVNCSSIEGQLAKLEVTGLKAFQLLQKILHPVGCPLENSWQLKKCSVVEADTENPSILENEDHISFNAIISLRVRDPRTLPEKGTAVAPEVTSAHILGKGREVEFREQTPLMDSNKDKELPPSPWLKSESSVPLDSKDIWDASKGISPPVEENALCLERHRTRLATFCLGDTNSGTLDTSTKPRHCPILLSKNTNQNGSPIGWSIILPLSWVKAFWIPLVSNGAHAIGLREKHWIANEVGLPCFPSDFPDCNAYTCFMATKATASDQKAELRPLAKRPLRVPTQPPWNCVRFSFDKEFTRVRDSHHCENDELSPGCRIISFQGSVARTSEMLISFLNEIYSDHLPLFPNNNTDGKINLSNVMKGEGQLSQGQNGAIQLNHVRKLCFLRVLLHAYREGVFEEGAVICAPQLRDISLWTSRSENNETGLQIPESSVSSYFREQYCGYWQLQIPEDTAARESHRWPIGFVTSGFVRGSKKPVASGLCEATLLACIRQEQWKEMPVKQRRKDIYVLVRNLRSTAYRLALATIVVEQHEDISFFRHVISKAQILQ